MSDLCDQKCEVCSTGAPKLDEKTIENLHKKVPEWLILEDEGVKKLFREFKFKTFKDALSFTNKIGEIAEKNGHHPMIITEWGKVKVIWWTHKIAGLHTNDFIMAAKSDLLV